MTGEEKGSVQRNVTCERHSIDWRANSRCRASVVLVNPFSGELKGSPLLP